MDVVILEESASAGDSFSTEDENRKKFQYAYHTIVGHNKILTNWPIFPLDKNKIDVVQ